MIFATLDFSVEVRCNIGPEPFTAAEIESDDIRVRCRAGVEAESRKSIAGEAVRDAPGEPLFRLIDLLRRRGTALDKFSICSYTVLAC